MARGWVHTLLASSTLAAFPTMAEGEASGPAAADSGANALISGPFQLWNTPVHPFLAELPDWFLLTAGQRPQFGLLVLTSGLMEEELRRDAPGSASIVHALFVVVFAYALRQIAAERGESHPGWSHAVRDAQARQVVKLMHDDCAHAWTQEALARRAGLSRTALAERFRDTMGDTPLNHLHPLRMQRAIKLLVESSQTLEAVATAVGYQDAFSFSKVFKRTVGLSPKAFRQRDTAERSNPWRFAQA